VGTASSAIDSSACRRPGRPRATSAPANASAAKGSEVIVNVENQGDLEQTVHWHRLRLENRYDGTHESQIPVAVGERLSARVTFSDSVAIAGRAQLSCDGVGLPKHVVRAHSGRARVNPFESLALEAASQ
jgi:hypothetical protein